MVRQSTRRPEPTDTPVTDDAAEAPHPRNVVVPLVWARDRHAALAFRHGIEVIERLVAAGAVVAVCLIEDEPIPAPQDRALRRIAAGGRIATERPEKLKIRIEGNKYAEIAYRFYLWARSKPIREIWAANLFGVTYYCLRERQNARCFQETEFGILMVGSTRQLWADCGEFPEADGLGRLFLEDVCLEYADLVVDAMAEVFDSPPAAAPAGDRDRGAADAGAGGYRLVCPIGETADDELRFLAKTLKQAAVRLPAGCGLTVITPAQQLSEREHRTVASLRELLPTELTCDADDHAMAVAVDHAHLVVDASGCLDRAWLVIRAWRRGVPVATRGHPAWSRWSRDDAGGLALDRCDTPTALADRVGAAVAAGARPAGPAVAAPPVPPARRRSRGGAPAAARDRPLVSVCMPHHNRPHLLLRAIESIKQQTYPSIEIVVVDDGSDGADSDRVLGQLSRDPSDQITVVRQENRYAGAARNTAVRHARGEFIMFMDDDNLAKKQEVEVLMSAAVSADADLAICFLDLFTEHPDGQKEVTARRIFIGEALAAGLVYNCFGDTNLLIRRQSLLDLGGFTEDYGISHEDYELLVRAAMAGVRFTVVPEPLFLYREDGDGVNTSSALNLNQARSLRPYLESEHWASDIARFAKGCYITMARTHAEWNRHEETRRRIQADLEATVAALDAELATIRRSHSWRVTAPLRAAATALRRLLGRPPP